MDYSLALEHAYSDFTYDLTGNTYAGLTWTDPVEPKPTDAECITAYDDWVTFEADTEYLRKREMAFLNTFAINNTVETIYSIITDRQTDGHTVSQVQIDFKAAVDGIYAAYPAP